MPKQTESFTKIEESFLNLSQRIFTVFVRLPLDAIPIRRVVLKIRSLGTRYLPQTLSKINILMAMSPNKGLVKLHDRPFRQDKTYQDHW